jgi:hypothetical protein
MSVETVSGRHVAVACAYGRSASVGGSHVLVAGRDRGGLGPPPSASESGTPHTHTVHSNRTASRSIVFVEMPPKATLSTIDA